MHIAIEQNFVCNLHCTNIYTLSPHLPYVKKKENLKQPGYMNMGKLLAICIKRLFLSLNKARSISEPSPRLALK
jgi:hypothetical protein